MSKKIYVCDYCGSEVVITEDRIYCENCGCEFDDVVGLSFTIDSSLYESDAGWDVND